MDFNVEYEYILINIMFIDNTLIDNISGVVKPKAFYDAKTRRIYETIIDQYSKSQICSIATLCSQLKGIDPADIAELTNRTASSENWEYYADNIKRMYATRKLKVKLAEDSKNLNPENVLDTIHDLDSSLTDYMKYDDNKPVDVKDLCNEMIKQVQEAAKNDSPYLGYDTGFENLSGILDGLQLGKLVILGARPSVGKTSFALQLAGNLCKQNIPVSIFSLEMTAKSLMTRLTSVETGFSIYELQHGMCFSQANITRLQGGLSRIYNMPLQIFDSGISNEKTLISQIRVQAKTKGTKVFVVDHIGLVRHSTPQMKRVEQLDDITQKLLHVAQELNVTIICLCQLRRDAEGQKPCLADLRDSGAIEQNADICMFLHRDRAEGNEMFIPAEVIVIKDRDGACGTAKMNFIPKKTKFEEIKETE